MTPDEQLGENPPETSSITYEFDDRPSTPPPPGPKKADGWTIVLGILGGVLLGTGVTLAILGFTGVFTEPTTPTPPPSPTLTAPPATTPPDSIAQTPGPTEVAARAIPSIVSVEVSSLLVAGGGSGVVFGDGGHIVTNNHVVQGASDIVVVFSDGARFPGELVGTDPLTDLAVIRVDRGDLTTIEMGSTSDIEIGQRAVAVGNPLGLSGGPSVTTGIISAMGRSLAVDSGDFLYGLIQTDAPITRGSSGGALLDGAARLIGITTAIAVSDVGAEGLGFAVPIDMVIAVVNDLISTGRVEHALLGIRATTAFAEQDGAEFPVGVGVTAIDDGGAYDVAGGSINDVIVDVDGVPVTTQDELLTQIRFHRSGDEVPITVLREDTRLEIIATMGLLEP